MSSWPKVAWARRSEGATLDRWLSALPAAAVRARPRLCLAEAVAAIVGGRLEAVEPLVADAERAVAAAGDEPHEPSVGRALSVLANVPASMAFLRADVARLRGDAARALDFNAQALEVLRLLAAGKSNQQIADELVVTLATVKKHVGHILGKLAAGNRTQAVARARVLGLLR